MKCLKTCPVKLFIEAKISFWTANCHTLVITLFLFDFEVKFGSQVNLQTLFPKSIVPCFPS